MIISKQDIKLEGQVLNCTIMDPSSGMDTRGVCLFTHGQGDHSGRYNEVLHPFTERGIRCIAFDLRGHGISSGKRGHVGDLNFIDALINKSIEMADDLPYGIAGHSMGGLLSLRHLTLALQGKLPMPAFCWINSALISPVENKTDTFVKFAQLLAKFHPTFTVATGARPELCQTPIDGQIRQKDTNHPGHRYISIGWGVELIKTAKYVQDHLPTIKSDIPFLYTQGGEDLICPEHIAKKFNSSLQLSNKIYKVFPHMRHETFAEPEQEQLFQIMGDWLDNSL